EWPLDDHIDDNNILKRKRHTSIENRNSASTSEKQNNQQRHEPIASTLSNLLPRYLTVFDCTFKHILSTTLENANLIVPWLDTKQKLQSTRQLAHTINKLHAGMTEDGSTTHISRYAAKEHATCTTYGRSRKIVEQRLATINDQLKRTTKELQEISVQLPQ
ncbi:unnamed protein product, partial [Rotaria socialis]